MILALSNPVEQTASLLGFLFGVSGEDVLGKGRPRATRDGTTLRYLLLHLLAKPPGQDVSPIGLSLTQDEIVAAMGRTDRGLVKVGASAIEEQTVFAEPHLALTAIADWIQRFFALIAEGRALATQLAREDVTPNTDVIGWRQSLTWQKIIAFGRTLRLREPTAERYDLWDEQEEEDLRREAARTAARKASAKTATQERLAPALKRAAASKVIADRELETLAKARAKRTDPILKKSQAVLDTVRRDPALQHLLGPLEVAGPGFVALSGKGALTRAEPALRGGGLTVSLFFKSANKAFRKEVRQALAKLFPACPISDHDYGEGKNACVRTDALLPAGA